MRKQDTVTNDDNVPDALDERGIHKSIGFPIGIAGFLLGGLIAASVALLYAPKSGEETRADIKDKAMMAKTRAEMAIDGAKASMQNAADELQGRTRQVLDRVEYEARYRANRLKDIGSVLVNEQKTSLERGVDGALDVMKS